MFAAGVATAAIAGCGTDDAPSTDDLRSSAGAVVTSVKEGAEGALSSVQSAGAQAGDAIDQAQLSAFVAAFRAAYPDLSADRETSSIETIVTETCPLVDEDASDDDIRAKVAETATNGSAEPTDDQVGQITQMVRAACL
ncbi:MAG: hypothetical protein GXY65_15380 [Rhodococcus sp.]|nr:hypothetical protein [Rhodococcus sp. (in: high G+C Gram-positive bacteria)]